MRVRPSSRHHQNFRLVTADVIEREGLLRRFLGRHNDGVFSRYISAGGTRETRKDSLTDLRSRSTDRLTVAIWVTVVLWILFYFV